MAASIREKDGSCWPIGKSMSRPEPFAWPEPSITRVAILRPGMFGRIRAVTGIAKGALLVPQRSVVETQGSYSVVVVGSDNKASIRPVKTGERVGQMWVITEGVKPGEQVIAEGIQKAKEGDARSPQAVHFDRQGDSSHG